MRLSQKNGVGVLGQLCLSVSARSGVEARVLIGYASPGATDDSSELEAEVSDLKAEGCEEIFVEPSGLASQRERLADAIRSCRPRDTLVVVKVDRLARSTVQFWSLVQELEAKGAGLRILDLGGDTIDTTSEARQLILAVFAGFAQFEHDMMVERQRRKTKKAKATGVFAGRKPTAMAKADEIRRLRNEGLGAMEIARRLKIGRSSVYRALDIQSSPHRSFAPARKP